jgi:hypothetical protein
MKIIIIYWQQKTYSVEMTDYLTNLDTSMSFTSKNHNNILLQGLHVHRRRYETA